MELSKTTTAEEGTAAAAAAAHRQRSNRMFKKVDSQVGHQALLGMCVCVMAPLISNQVVQYCTVGHTVQTDISSRVSQSVVDDLQTDRETDTDLEGVLLGKTIKVSKELALLFCLKTPALKVTKTIKKSSLNK